MHDNSLPLSETVYGQRLGALRRRVTAEGIDALAVTSSANRHYLSGIPTSAGLALVSQTDAWFLTDSRYYEAVRRYVPHFTLVEVGYQTWEGLAGLLAKTGFKRVGFEADVVTVKSLTDMQAKVPAADWVASSGLVEGLRTVKSADELAVISRAAAIADAAILHAYANARPGQTEKELAWKLEVFMRERGADGLAFEIIVGAGEHGALPHHSPTDREIRAGEPIVIDLGARVDSYHSDLTRTFSLGPATDPDYEAVFDLVREAEERAIRLVRPEMKGGDVDALSRDVIKAAGHGDHFGHGLGHGVGLNVHEAPRVSYGAPDVVIPDGSVITIEPGVYLPDRFGVRIEDLIVVTPEGGRRLSHAPIRSSVPLPSA